MQPPLAETQDGCAHFAVANKELDYGISECGSGLMSMEESAHTASSCGSA